MTQFVTPTPRSTRIIGIMQRDNLPARTNAECVKALADNNNWRLTPSEVSVLQDSVGGEAFSILLIVLKEIGALGEEIDQLLGNNELSVKD